MWFIRARHGPLYLKHRCIIPNLSRGYSFFNLSQSYPGGIRRMNCSSKATGRSSSSESSSLSYCSRSLRRCFIAQLEFKLWLRLALGAGRPSCAFWIVHWMRGRCGGVSETRRSLYFAPQRFLGHEVMGSSMNRCCWTRVVVHNDQIAWILDSKRLKRYVTQISQFSTRYWHSWLYWYSINIFTPLLAPVAYYYFPFTDSEVYSDHLWDY